MSFINKESNVVINTKLTTLGRSLLANGKLNFTHFAVGDSEVDYNFITKYGINPLDLRVLKPVDKNAEIKHFVKPTTSSVDYRVALSTPTPNAFSVTAQTQTKGFFTGTKETGFQLKTTPEYIKSTYTIAPSSITGKPTVTVTGVSSLTGITVNDYVLIGWKTTASAAAQHLWYKVVKVSGLAIELDKNVPNMPTGSAKMYVFPSGQSLKYYYSNTSEREKVTPVWGFTIVYGRSMEGAPNKLRASSYPSSAYIGFKNYLHERKEDKALGVIHYTNYNKLNEYGESLFKDSFVLDLPTIMYDNNTTTTVGLTLTSGSVAKTFTGGTTDEFATPYYDLLDPKGKAVGKVFIDYKVATIEDQEILAAMSMKSNRCWTLPDFTVTNYHSTDTGQDLYVTYQLVTHNGDGSGFVTALHSQNIHKFDSKALDYIDFVFNADGLRFMNQSGAGYKATKFLLLFQRVAQGSQPVHDKWVTYDFTSRLPNHTLWQGGSIPTASLSGVTHRINEQMITDAYLSVGQKGNYNLNYLLPNLTSNNANPFTLKGFGAEDNGPAI